MMIIINYILPVARNCIYLILLYIYLCWILANHVRCIFITVRFCLISHIVVACEWALVCVPVVVCDDDVCVCVSASNATYWFRWVNRWLIGINERRELAFIQLISFKDMIHLNHIAVIRNMKQFFNWQFLNHFVIYVLYLNYEFTRKDSYWMYFNYFHV